MSVHTSVTKTASFSCGIAMCTCNGGIFLEEQLGSILNQTRLPNHIVISDDCSEDGSWDLLRTWASDAITSYGIRVTLFRNETRLGVARNFEQAIAAVDADIIFLADQDDVWARNKIEVLAGRMGADPEILLAHSDAFLVDERGRNLGKTLFEALCLSTRDRELVRLQRFFEVYCRRNLVTGTTTAFRRELLQMALPFPQDWIHDEWLAVCAAALAKVAMLPEKLTEYRQHGANVIGMPNNIVSRLTSYATRVAKTPRDEYLRYKRRRLDALRCRLLAVDGISHDKIALVVEAEMHFARRLQFAHGLLPRLGSVIKESKAHGYHRFADGIGGMVRDLIHL